MNQPNTKPQAPKELPDLSNNPDIIRVLAFLREMRRETLKEMMNTGKF